jgi:carbonic anhydrase
MTDKSPLSVNLAALLDANQYYSKTFDQAELKPAPTKHFAILTCMDARMDPYKFAGLNDGEAHIIRNAGGRATDDAIRSLVISHKFLGTLEWFVIHHTNCGMTLVTDEAIGDLLEHDLETAVHNGECWVNPERQQSENTKPGSSLGKKIEWHTFTDLRESVLNDMNLIRNHELVPNHIRIHGFIFDVKSGRLSAVED